MGSCSMTWRISTGTMKGGAGHARERGTRGRSWLRALLVWGCSGAISRGALLRSGQRRSSEVPAGLDGTRGGGGWPDAENEGGREAGCRL